MYVIVVGASNTSARGRVMCLFVTPRCLLVARSNTQTLMHLFDGVHYFLSTSFPESRINELSHVLDSNGASVVESIDDSSLTHFITNSNSFERWQEIATREEEGTLVVVTVRCITSF